MSTEKIKRSRGRPRRFDEDAVIQSAMGVFWANGYEGSSLDQLTTAMGITRSSLYQAFGNKEDLFLTTVERYLEDTLQPAMNTLKGEPQLETALRGFMSAIVISATAHADHKGCLITCVLADSAGSSVMMANKLENAFNRLEDVLVQRLDQAVHCGQLSNDVDTTTRAAVVAATARGLTLRARAGTPRPQLLAIAEAAIPLLAS